MAGRDFLDDYVTNENLGPVFRSFSTDERRAMMEEDLFAGRSVSTVLLAIVTMGMLLMAGTVLITLL